MPMKYRFRLLETQASIGFGAYVPEDDMSLGELLEELHRSPMDEFLRGAAIRAVQDAPDEELRSCAQSTDLIERSLVREAFAGDAEKLKELGLGEAPDAEECAASPLVDLRNAARENQALHSQWAELLQANIMRHEPLPDAAELPASPYSPEECAEAGKDIVALSDLHFVPKKKKAPKLPTCDALTWEAQGKLEKAGVELSQQSRHTESLAPNGLVRQWRRKVSVKNGALEYTLEGMHTSFGRGMDFATAQVALTMEIVERYSSWVSVDGLELPEQRSSRALVHGSYEELRAAGHEILDPSRLPLNVTYSNEALYWLPCDMAGKNETCLVPAQCLFLFCNLDEPALFAGLGSTGLAAGTVMEQARLSALMEIIERDAETVTPVDPAAYFRIRSTKPEVQELLDQYARKGYDVLFMECTSELGIPCYHSFVTGPQGQLMKGASASLSGPKAALSALLEVPYPFPFGPESRKGPAEAPYKVLEDLPDFSTGNMVEDLRMVEQLLIESGRRPLYANLTHKELGYPVVRAVIPGLELLPDYDPFTRISPRVISRILSKKS